MEYLPVDYGKCTIHDIHGSHESVNRIEIPKVSQQKPTPTSNNSSNLNPFVPDKAKTVPCWPRSLVDWDQTR